MSKVPTSPFTILYLGNGEIEKLSRPEYGYIYYKNYRQCLLTGKRENYSFFSFLEQLDHTPSLSNSDKTKILHLFYEAGHYFVTSNLKEILEVNSLKKNDIPLAIDLSYSSSEVFNIPRLEKKSDLSLLNRVDEEEYQSAFGKGVLELEKGNCYQFNLTFPLSYKIENQETEFESLFYEMLQDKKKVGAFAHCTFLPNQNKGYLSNSPECLFQAKEHKNKLHLWTMPIKGTIENRNGESKSNWKKLSHSLKDEGELNMITDLLKNDLCKIETPSAKVVKEKCMLKVPGLLHQFSLLEIYLSSSVRLGRILKALFPGGSITGAPKKNVVRILDQLEEGKIRGFYTGSTILSDKKRLVASINIRSAECDWESKEVSVSAGGGVTLMSDCQLEYQEMEKKRESFVQLFN